MYEIKIPVFEGAFDLLLFFIERDELDIYDIPITKVTTDFLEYIRTLEKMNIELASEFIVVAATLMQIKAKMLLPREQVDEEGNIIDPRKELVQQLLEYKRYRPVIEQLSNLEDDALARETRGNIISELKSLNKVRPEDVDLEDVDLYKLLKAFQNAMELHELSKPKMTNIKPYPYSVDRQRDYVINKVKTIGRVNFVEVLKESGNRVLVVFNFLAILELIQVGEIRLEITEEPNFNEFILVKGEPSVVG
ncbi:segregation and condensation protein A [Bernardetia sp.]|uniref:segregation and condensation protein A n=1 Tax=Bernardetia sp. TaxID=1937974 RepID=UPI0025C15DC5|nr:segregation/condensation protein A [Bernardetia sp.]